MKKKIYLGALFYTIIDQLIKYIINSNLLYNHDYAIINHFFYLTKIYNYGAAWNILNNQRFLLIIFTLVFLFYVNKHLENFKNNNYNLITFSLLIGGIIGNLIDRTIKGYVIDYLHCYPFGYNYPVFNIADMGIVIGVILIIINIMKGEDKNDSRKS